MDDKPDGGGWRDGGAEKETPDGRVDMLAMYNALEATGGALSILALSMKKAENVLLDKSLDNIPICSLPIDPDGRAPSPPISTQWQSQQSRTGHRTEP